MLAINNESINLPIGWSVISGIQAPVDVFVGYLLLDAWIGNGDRHHENWGLIKNKTVSDSKEIIMVFNINLLSLKK